MVAFARNLGVGDSLGGLFRAGETAVSIEKRRVGRTPPIKARGLGSDVPSRSVGGAFGVTHRGVWWGRLGSERI